MGRNQSFDEPNNTDKPSRNRSLIRQSRENINKASFKSPHQRGNRVKQPLQYYRSQSKEKKSISSKIVTNKRNFPPIGFGSKILSDTIKERNILNISKGEENNHSLIKLNEESLIMSPIPFEKKYFGKGCIREQNLNNEEPSLILNHNRRLDISNKNRISGGFVQDVFNASRTADGIEPIIALEMETPRLPSPQVQFQNSNKSLKRKPVPKTKKRSEISLKEVNLNRSSQSFIDEN